MRSRVGSNSRYDRTVNVGGREADEARALHVVADLLDNYPGIDAPVIASRLGEILRATAIALIGGRDVPIGIRRAARRLADAVRVEMHPPT
jgi:hypothetical protein